jgi:acyl-ACP thioesterase
VDAQVSKIMAKTWLEGTKGPYCRRIIEFYVDGELRFVTHFFCLLFDLNTRTFFRKLPEGIQGKRPNSKDCAPARWKAPEGRLVMRRTARQSDTDCLGHVNNTRYAAFAFDALTADEIENFGALKEFEVVYKHELSPGINFGVYKSVDEKNIYVSGLSGDSESQTQNFNAVFRF